MWFQRKWCNYFLINNSLFICPVLLCRIFFCECVSGTLVRSPRNTYSSSCKTTDCHFSQIKQAVAQKKEWWCGHRLDNPTMKLMLLNDHSLPMDVFVHCCSDTSEVRVHSFSSLWFLWLPWLHCKSLCQVQKSSNSKKIALHGNHFVSESAYKVEW